jgi:uncharacterized protein YciI
MLFSILIHDEPNSAALRDEYRAAHISHLKGFDAQTLFSGPFTDNERKVDLGNLNLPDRLAVERYIEGDPYVISGIQKHSKIHLWRPSVPYTWRDCPREEGNIHALFFGMDFPGGMAKRIENRDAHENYLSTHGKMVIARGPLLTDNGSKSIGSIWLLDLPNLDTRRELLEGDPFYKSGIYKEEMLVRWHF